MREAAGSNHYTINVYFFSDISIYQLWNLYFNHPFWHLKLYLILQISFFLLSQIFYHSHSFPWSKFCSYFCCFSISESTNEFKNVSNAGWIVELPSSIHVFATFIVGALFKGLDFCSRIFPEMWWENAIHWLIGMLRALGNFYTQKSASL